MLRRLHILIAAAQMILCQGAVLFAQDAVPREERGRVSYVTSTTVYADVGRRNGFREGDTLKVLRGGKVVALLQIENLSSKSASARVLGKDVTIVKDDVVAGTVVPLAPLPVIEKQRDSASIPIQAADAKAEERSPVLLAEEEGAFAHIKGRVALQYYGLQSSTSSSLAFSQPAAVVDFTLDDLADLPLAFSWYSNHRYDARDGAVRRGVAQPRWRNRFYEAALSYGADADALSASFGRFVPYQVGGIGTVDGLMLRGRSKGWEGGMIAGSQPDYVNSAYSPEDRKWAAYAGYSEQWSDQRFWSNLAYAQTYRGGALDRGYFYLVSTYGLGGTVNMYQNATVDMYDADRGSGHQNPHLTDLYLSATVRPIRTLALTGSYANRRGIYFLRSFASLPDSLFNSSRLQQYQLSAGMNIPGGMHAAITGLLRTEASLSRPANSISARYTWADLFSSRMNFYLFASLSDNVSSRSRMLGGEINRDLFQSLYTAIRLQQYRISYNSPRDVSSTTLTLDLYYRFSTMLYLSLSYEHYWEGALSSNRIYTEASVRFR